jgi:hypothetical protein
LGYASSRNAFLLYGDFVFGDSIFPYQEGVFADPGRQPAASGHTIAAHLKPA